MLSCRYMYWEDQCQGITGSWILVILTSPNLLWAWCRTLPWESQWQQHRQTCRLQGWMTTENSGKWVTLWFFHLHIYATFFYVYAFTQQSILNHFVCACNACRYINTLKQNTPLTCMKKLQKIKFLPSKVRLIFFKYTKKHAILLISTVKVFPVLQPNSLWFSCLEKNKN